MNKDNSKIYLLVLLGLLTAFGPFVTDMYLPTLPAMTDFFHTSSSMVQMGLTTSMIGLAAGQLLFGPLSDKYGRRTPLLTAMWLFIGSTLLCIFASDIRQFVTARFLQGIAGSGGIVISRSVATDRFGGRDLARMLALIGAVNGVAPVVAPIIGGTLTDSIGWQGIFCILLMLGCVLLAGCFRLRESLPAERRSAVAWGDIFRSFGTVLRNRRYVAYVLQMGFAQGVLFAYIASSPFIMQGHYGFSAFEFSICFAVNAVAIGSAAAFSIRFRNPERSTRAGCMGMLLFAAAEAVALGLGCGFWVYEGLLFGLLPWGSPSLPPRRWPWERPANTPELPRPCWAPSASRSAASCRRWSASATRSSPQVRSSSSAPSAHGSACASPRGTQRLPPPEKRPETMLRPVAVSPAALICAL